MAQIPTRRDRAQTVTLRRSEDTINDLALDEWAQERNVFGRVENLDQPDRSAEQRCRRLTDSEPMAMQNLYGFGEVFPAEHLADHRQVEPEEHREKRHFFGRLDNLALNGN